MLLDTPAVERLVEAFRRLPGIGKRSAERLALHLLSAPAEDAKFLGEAVIEARTKITSCSECWNLTEIDPCAICADDRRDADLICVVEQPAGAMAVEKAGTFRGRYHVLHGVLNPLEGTGPEELKLDRLFRRVQKTHVREVIIATNATTEGEHTAMYLSRRLNEMNVKATRIAHGVPMGGGLEYADEKTLMHALQGRTEM